MNSLLKSERVSYKSTVKDPMKCKKLDIYIDLPFRLLQEELIPCYTKMGGATVQWQVRIFPDLPMSEKVMSGPSPRKLCMNLGKTYQCNRPVSVRKAHS